MTGRQLLEALAHGTEMHKAWEGGSGGSRRLVQVQWPCIVSCAAAIRGWDARPWALRGTMPVRWLLQHVALRLWPHTTPGL